VSGRRWCVVGGAGFIGSHFVRRLLGAEDAAAVTVYDNFSSGRWWHLDEVRDDPRLRVVEAEVKDLEALVGAMTGCDVVIHLASNPDISRAVTEPTIDFWEGTFLTNQVVEAMRRSGTPKILYASGSGVYGDLGTLAAEEDHGPLIPSSTYGASKLAGEGLISSYAHMFDLVGCAFRFGNVVGPNQTHGVGFDFVRRLRDDPTRLRVLGDGEQSKSYIHVHDVIAAVLRAEQATTDGFRAFNVATGDYITVTEIADIACRALGLDPAAVHYEYTGGDRGWKGDVPIVRLDTGRIRSLGWACSAGSAAALDASIRSMVEQLEAGVG